MKDTILQRLALLREEMRREKLSAFIFPSTDPHNGEYVPDHWKGREWITGFNGSAGTAVVTLHSAALWTDSRYFIAATQQLDGTGIQLMKERLPETPTISQWLGRQLDGVQSPEAGIDGMVSSAAGVSALREELRMQGGITLRTNFDPLQRIWADRPALPEGLVQEHPLCYSGEDCRDKMARLRATLRTMHADGILVTALDDIAWLLNLRCDDVHCNPVFVSYLLVSTGSATLYINKVKLTPAVEAYLRERGIATDRYENVGKGLAAYSDYNILADPSAVNHTLFSAIRCHKVEAPSPVPYMKAVKNEAEIKGFRRAMERDGVAMVKFLRWLGPAVEAGGQTELTVSARLEELRGGQEHYRGLSFDTIAAYQEHGAIVHYEPEPATDAPLRAEGLLLLDSGAQYLDGTTDITRTLALGSLTDEQRFVYTQVLKSHIQLEMLKFPRGASGTQLDAVARQNLWREGLNYMHGTGHGVGSYLNVHEGPHQIRMEYKPAPMLPGMTVTDEPGIYLAGRFGVRIENTLLVTEYRESEFGEFLQFEPLTLCPFDMRPVVLDMLTPAERQWINQYHEEVRRRLTPLLDEGDAAWLAQATKAI